MPKLFVSDTILDQRLAIARPEPGADSEGWRKLAFLYKVSFDACGYRIMPLTRPEIYQAAAAHQILGIEAADRHLAVKPIEHLRPFHGLPNIFVCDWPFPELSTGPCGDSPFYDQAHLLGLADAVLCCTPFTTQSLRRAGVSKAITLPPVIPARMRQADMAFPRSGPIRFLSVADSITSGRQSEPVIEGFVQAARQDAGLHLTVCVPGGDRRCIAELEGRIAQARTAYGPNIAASISVLGAQNAAAAIVQAAWDFFLCADPAPGLCIPLVEAMLAGLPVVTTITAGTASFLSPAAAIPVATAPGPVTDDEPIARFLPLTANPATAEAVRDALLAAAALDAGNRALLGEAGRQIAERLFGDAAFKVGIRQIEALIAVQTP